MRYDYTVAKPRLRPLLQRVARAWAYFPVRVSGLALAAVGALVAWKVGKTEADFLLYPAGLAAIGLVAINLAAVACGTFFVWESVRDADPAIPDELETNHPQRTGFRFRWLAYWPLVEARMVWDEPEEVEVKLDASSRWAEEIVRPRQRGRHARVIRRFTIEDVFGLCSFSFRVTYVHSVRVLPATAVAGAEIATAQSYGDAFSHPTGRAEGDLIEMRGYGPGDPMRFILWKTFARTRRLLVRMPERSVAPKPITVSFMVAGPGDEPTAATARLYLEKKLFGPDFVFSADGAEKPTSEVYEALEQIVDSVRARSRSAEGIEALAAQVDPARLASCVVFAPPVDGAWRERVSAFARKLPTPPTIVIGVDATDEEDLKQPALRRRVHHWLWRRDDDTPPLSAARLTALRAALEAEGLRVQVLHRGTGAML
jgi:hypothetical protein